MTTQSVQAAIGVAVLSVVVPLGYRILSSPVTLIVILLPLLLVAVLVCISSTAILGYVLDRKKRGNSRRKLAYAARPLSFSTPAAWQAVVTRSSWLHRSMQSLPPLRRDYPIASAAINEILSMVVRDFILVWYSEISPSPSFPAAISEGLHASLEILLKRVEALDLASLIVRRILPKLTAHVDQFKHSETALRGAGLERHLTQSEELDLLLASRYAGKGGRLHPAVDNLSSTFTKQTEEAHLRQLIDAALPFILPHKDANSRTVRIVAREVLACTVFAPITDMLSDPDYWNRTIDQLAGAAIRQQKLITKVRNILEIQSASPTKARSRKPNYSKYETITLRTDSRQFEAFLRSISRCDSLLDARRLKNDIVGEIRRTRALLAKHENEEWINGRRTEDFVAFLDRLYTAKRKVEKRIAVLGGQDDSRSSVAHDNVETSLTLRDLLTNPSSLSYFMEFMDRRGRSLLVQFWLTVETFKNPLESVESDSSVDERETPEAASSSPTLREDLTMVKELYFSGPVVPSVLSCISQKYIDAVQAYAAQPTASQAQERRVRRSVMLAQRQVEREMVNDFEAFQRTDLWFRVVSDLAASLGQQASSRPNEQLQMNHSTSSTSSNLPVFVKHPSPGEYSGRRQPLPPGQNRQMTLPLGQEPGRVSPAVSSGGGHYLHTMQGPNSRLEILMAPLLELDAGVSRAPLFDEADDGTLLSADLDEAQRMEAIQAAVTDIIASENRLSSEQPLEQRRSSDDSLQNVLDDVREQSTAPKRRPVFEDTEQDMDDTVPDDNDEDEGAQSTFQMPAPGDLQLSSEIGRLTDKITHLQSQDVILDTLIRKAELTGDAQELRLLRRSKSALERELRQLTFQRAQYEQQESANKLVPGRTKVAIVNSTVGEEGGKSVVRYLVEVQQLAPDGSHASGWVVARRYNEFFVMHQRLRERFLTVKNLDFPGKRLVTPLSSSMVDHRRVALEKYLQNLLAIPMVCETQELRAFLSRESPFVSKDLSDSATKETHTFPGQNLVRTMYRSFTESIDDMFFGPSMLDVMIVRLTRQAAEFAGIVGSGMNDEDLVVQALRASGPAAPDETLMHLPGDLKPLGGESSTSPFTAPICDFILSVFELDEKNNWLRRQAIVIILQQVLGDTIERKFRDSMKGYLDEPHLMTYINMFKDGMWSGGILKPAEAPRSPEEKARTRDDANRKLSALLPDIAANMMGRSNARRGARRIFAVLQNRRLNQHIIYTLLDEMFMALFPEATLPVSTTSRT